MGRCGTGAREGVGTPLSRLPPLSVAPEILLRYLQEQNRPYSAQDVFGNLQRDHGLGKAVRTRAWALGAVGDPSCSSLGFLSLSPGPGPPCRR